MVRIAAWDERAQHDTIGDGMQTVRQHARKVACVAGISLALLVSGATAVVPQSMASLPALAPAQALAAPYPDTPNSAWYVAGGYVDYVTSRGLMAGYADTGLFGPEDTVTRAQACAVILRWADPSDLSTKVPSEYGTVTSFSDVPVGQWYTSAVEYCRAIGVVTGDRDASGNPLGTFRPDDPVTREELAAMMQRLAAATYGASGGSGLSGFADAGAISAWAREAMSWACANGVLTGDTSTGVPMANPKRNATRAQFAKMVTVLFRDVVAGAPAPSKPPAGGTGDEAKPGAGAAPGTQSPSKPSEGSGTQAGKPAEKTWHETKPAWDEQVLVKATWDEQVLVKEAWDEQVLVKDAWDEQVLVSEEWWEQVIVGSHYVCHYDGYIAYTDEELTSHLKELIQQGVNITSYYVDYDYETVHHPDEYETVHHGAEYKTVHHEAEYKTVHHEAEYRTVHHDAEGYWS